MEQHLTEYNVSIQEVIQLAKQAANISDSPPRLYKNDASGVHLWPDTPSQVQYPQPPHPEVSTGTPSPYRYRKREVFALTLQVMPHQVEVPLHPSQLFWGWIRRESPKPQIRFDGWLITFRHAYVWLTESCEGFGGSWSNSHLEDNDEYQQKVQVLQKMEELRARLRQSPKFPESWSEHGLIRVKDQFLRDAQQRQQRIDSQLQIKRHYWQLHFNMHGQLQSMSETGDSLPPRLPPSDLSSKDYQRC